MAYHILVSGKVQGVFYRKSTFEKATALKLTGWVKNLKNGDVEIEAEGSPEAVQKLIEWCGNGPTNAVVISLKSSEIKPSGHDQFRIVRD